MAPDSVGVHDLCFPSRYKHYFCDCSLYSTCYSFPRIYQHEAFLREVLQDTASSQEPSSQPRSTGQDGPAPCRAGHSVHRNRAREAASPALLSALSTEALLHASHFFSTKNPAFNPLLYQLSQVFTLMSVPQWSEQVK